jgi:hypothetical protein
MGKRTLTIRLDGISRWLLVLLVVLVAAMWLFPRPIEAEAQDNAELERQVLRRILGLLDGAATELAEVGSQDPDTIIVQSDLQALRTQIQLFKLEIGRFPGVDPRGRFDPQRFVRELTQTVESPDGMRKGPWLSEMVYNPITGSSEVRATEANPPEGGDPSAGWIFNPSTGHVWAAHDVSL